MDKETFKRLYKLVSGQLESSLRNNNAFSLSARVLIKTISSETDGAIAVRALCPALGIDEAAEYFTLEEDFLIVDNPVTGATGFIAAIPFEDIRTIYTDVTACENAASLLVAKMKKAKA